MPARWITASTPGEVLRLDVADVEPPLDVGACPTRAEHTVLEQHAVDADHLVASRLQHRHQHGADVTVMSCHEHSHCHTFHGASPLSHSRSSMTLSRIVSMHAQKSVCLYAISCPSAARRSSGSRSNSVSSPSM